MLCLDYYRIKQHTGKVLAVFSMVLLAAKGVMVVTGMKRGPRHRGIVWHFIPLSLAYPAMYVFRAVCHVWRYNRPSFFFRSDKTPQYFSERTISFHTVHQMPIQRTMLKHAGTQCRGNYTVREHTPSTRPYIHSYSKHACHCSQVLHHRPLG